MTIVGATISSRDALNHLRSIKPNDGWSIQVHSLQTGDVQLRLLRRNAPLTDGFFCDIHYSASHKVVVGVLTKDAEICQRLVDGTTGRPILQKTLQHISCAKSYPGYKVLTKAEQEQASTRSRSAPIPANNNNNNNMTNPFADLSDADRQLYMKYATMGIGGVVVYKILTDLLGDALLFFLVLPAVYFYGVSTCPSNASFDAKKEVKRVLRGHHLPEDHPAKPRKGNFLEEWTAKISASVATEVSAVAGGYSTDIAPLLGGCAKHAVVTLPTLGLTCEWIGCNDTWYHYRTYDVPR